MLRISLFITSQSQTFLNSVLTTVSRILRSLSAYNKLIPPAKRKNLKILDDSQMSLMYIQKSRVPRTDPWGTPHKGTFLDKQFSVEVVCERPLRYERNQLLITALLSNTILI